MVVNTTKSVQLLVQLIFIFGYVTAIFQNCQILVKQGNPTQKNIVIAHERYNISQTPGFSFQLCNVLANHDLLPTTETYLGRPWMNYSRTIFMESYLSSIINSKGSLEMHGNAYLETCDKECLQLFGGSVELLQIGFLKHDRIIKNRF
jgi:pectin methylesterase-like acyl-CoA thioesterase